MGKNLPSGASERTAASRLLNTSLLLLFLLCLFVAVFFIDAGVLQAGAIAIIFLACTMWGHVAVFPLYYTKHNISGGFIWGCVAGISITSMIVSVVVFAAGWNVVVVFLLVFVLPACIFAFLWIRKAKGPTRRSGGSYTDGPYTVTALLLSLAIVSAFFIFPFKNLGVLVDGEYVYAWLFGHDFINRMVHIESLSRGLPLRSLVFEGEILSYYWLSYIFPALLSNLPVVDLEIKQILQMTQLLYSLLAAAALVLFLDKHLHGKKILIVSVGIALCCYSYVWLLNLARGAAAGIAKIYPSLGVEVLDIGFSGFSHGVYRFFLVEPQGVLSVAIILMILTIYDRTSGIYTFIAAGVFLGILFGVEAVNGIILMLWFFGISLYSLIFSDADRFATGFRHCVAGFSALTVYAVMFSVNMYSLSTGQGALQLSPNWFVLKAGAAYFPIMYGPPFVLGMAGLVLLFCKREAPDHWVYGHVLLLVVGLFFVFFIQNPTEYHFGLLKATRVIPVALLMLSVYFLQNHMRTAKKSVYLMLLIAAAFPSLVTDAIVASDIRNPGTFVRSADMDAAIWIRSNIPRDAVVQAEPNYPGEDRHGLWSHYAYSFIPIFAERATAIGEWKVSSQGHGKAGEAAVRFHAVRQMYSTENVLESLDIMRRYGIGYVYVGALEKQLYPKGVDKFHNELFFECVYSSGETSIYRFINP